MIKFFTSSGTGQSLEAYGICPVEVLVICSSFAGEGMGEKPLEGNGVPLDTSHAT